MAGRLECPDAGKEHDWQQRVEHARAMRPLYIRDYDGEDRKNGRFAPLLVKRKRKRYGEVKVKGKASRYQERYELVDVRMGFCKKCDKVIEEQ